MIKLHGLEVSGNTYKARLLMSFLSINYELVTIDVINQQHKSDRFKQLNPRGEFPVLEDESQIIWDSQAILIYLARQYGGREWFPESSASLAYITQWMTVANGEIFHSLGKARSIIKFGHDGDLESCQKEGRAILQWINQHLEQRRWIATESPSIADIACYPYIALCHEGGNSLEAYTAINQWIDRLQKLDRYISMPGIINSN